MDKSRSRKRMALVGSCILAALLLGLLCFIPVILTSRNRLSVIGRRVADASKLARFYDGYYWDTNDSQIVLVSGGRSAQKVRLDDHTGGTIPVPLPTIGPPLWNNLQGGERPSPDGKWLLFGHGSGLNYFAKEKSTGRIVQWKAASRSITFFLWFPDSKRWVEFDRSAGGNLIHPIIHSLDGPDLHTTPIKDSFVWPIGVTSEGHVLNARNQLHLELGEYNLDANGQAPQMHSIALPANSVISEVEGSPDGHQVAYLVQENYGSFISRLIDRIRPGRNDPANNKISLWVSRSDGSDLHRIGYERASEAAGVQWAPDGKRLSLFLNNGFYIVPVE